MHSTTDIREPDEPMLTVQELANLLRVSAPAVRRWQREGVGPQPIRVVGALRYRRTDVLAWLAANEVPVADVLNHDAIAEQLDESLGTRK